ncbi:MAG TPA: inorganic phosphate transporter [Candidatus Nanoarchaeia archaeon]|nr:inorganic phosphate transporter [Candidatus Nanoarchaeia archaeon]
MADLWLVIAGVVLALVFDFGNGLNDAANAISTMVATKVLSFRAAALLSAVGNIAAAFLFSTAVAQTIGKGLIDPGAVTVEMVIAGIGGAIFWVYLASYLGLPVSASHSLIGGYVGSAFLAGGPQVLVAGGIWLVLAFIFIAPVAGMVGGMLFSLGAAWMFRRARPARINRYFKRLQLVSALVYSLSHGANDAQKTIGIITILLFSGGMLTSFHVPFWVVLLSHLVIGAGTLAGGWKVVKTMGVRITKLKPVNGFCAETAGAAVIIFCSLFGIPVSTTHVISGSIIGVGTMRRATAVRWNIARNIVWAWIITIPVAALVGAMTYAVADVLGVIS